MSKSAIALDDALDKSFIYSVLLNESRIYYGRLRTLLKMPLILIASVMSVVNGNIGGQDDNTLKIVNITFNIVTALILGFGTTLKIDEKYQVFSSSEKKFLKLCSKIEQKLLNEDDIIHREFVKEIINEYDMIVENNLDYEIQSFICKRVRKRYAGKKTLPVIINGHLKDDIHRPQILYKIKTASMDEGIKTPKMCPSSYNLHFEKKKDIKCPIVIDTKPHVIDIPVNENILGQKN